MNNWAAIGYFILAAREAGLEDGTIKQIAEEMHFQMDICTEEEAIETYNSI